MGQRTRRSGPSRDELYRYARAIGEASVPDCTCPVAGVFSVDEYDDECPTHGRNA